MNPRDKDKNENRNENLEQPVKNNNTDLTDPVRDQERLRGEETTFDLPEVKDIPGQEHVHVLPLGELADTTISSDDEEGKGLLDGLNEEEEEDDIIRMGNESDITRDDREMLEAAEEFYPSKDEEKLVAATMDSTDLEGDPLNEKSFGTEKSGSDLDIPGSEDDDAMEETGSEDEENNHYGMGDTSNDRLNEATP